MNDRAEQLAQAHWGYIEGLLLAHNLTQAEVDAAAYHYTTAFVHGYKHAMEDVKPWPDNKPIEPSYPATNFPHPGFIDKFTTPIWPPQCKEPQDNFGELHATGELKKDAAGIIKAVGCCAEQCGR